MSATPPGWYGKIASLGDFAHRRLPPQWIAVCDAWLSRALRGAEATLQARWLDVYLTAPILRFAWAPGTIDPHWWVGVLMPSCDNVGRYFPLVIAQARSHIPLDRSELEHLECWYADIVAIALATLSGTRESLERMEEAIARLDSRPSAHPHRDWSEATVVDVRGASGLSALAAHAASPELGTPLRNRTAWWTVDPEHGCGPLEIVDGLPDGARFAALLQSGPPHARHAAHD